MKQDPITKLYTGLTDKERAALAFTYRTQHNAIEQDRIEAAMPTQYFIGLPLEYRIWTYNLQNLAMLYAIGYWRHVALAQATMGGATAMLHQTDDPAQWQPMIKRFEEAEAKLLSLEAAFDDVCVEHGLDTGTMRYIAGKQFYQVAHSDLMPDDAYREGMRVLFAEVLSLWP